jgi:hypothetical protein
MTKMLIPLPSDPMDRKKLGAPMVLKVILKGDRRMAESVILEVRAAAKRCGLEIPSIQIECRPAVGPKTKRLRQV